MAVQSGPKGSWPGSASSVIEGRLRLANTGYYVTAPPKLTTLQVTFALCNHVPHSQSAVLNTNPPCAHSAKRFEKLLAL